MSMVHIWPLTLAEGPPWRCYQVSGADLQCQNQLHHHQFLQRQSGDGWCPLYYYPRLAASLQHTLGGNFPGESPSRQY